MTAGERVLCRLRAPVKLVDSESRTARGRSRT